MPYGSSESFCNIGSAKAMVFPEPVFAFPMQSLPAPLSISSSVDTKTQGDAPAIRGGRHPT